MSWRDDLDIDGGVQGAADYKPARLVAPPSGRQRAARVAESGTLGGPRGKAEVVVMPFEDLQRLHKAGQGAPAADAAFRQVVREVLGEESATEALADPELAVLSRGGFVWLALAGSEKAPAGCVALYKTVEEEGAAAGACEETGRRARWELGHLAVRPQWRRQGVGRLLVETLLRQFAEAAGESEELLLEAPRSCEAARALFLKAGLAEADAGEGDAGASSDVVRMRLRTRTHRAFGGPVSAAPPAPRPDPRYFD